MSEVDERAVQVFGAWLNTLADDARTVSDVVGNAEISSEVKTPLAGALNYLFKSLDLIDDGIEGLGFLDDAFILRVAAADAKEAGALPEELFHLAADAALVREFLGDLSERFDRFVVALVKGSVRGRSVSAIIEDEATRDEMLADLRGWANRFKAPQFTMDEMSLVKIRSFLGAKLPKSKS